MATTENFHNGNGSTSEFAFTFPYLKETDIKVSVSGTVKTVDTHYTLHNATTIKFTSGNIPPSGTNTVRIYRETDDSKAASTFYAGSAIRAGDLNDNTSQTLYAVQEINNKSDTALTNSRVDNGDGTYTSAISKATTAVSSANTAVSTANSATTTANAASTSASNAVSTANTASTNASNAVTTANTASTNATNAVNTANAAWQTGTETVDSTEAWHTSDDSKIATTKAIQAQLALKQNADADLTNLSGCQTGASAALAALTEAEVQVLDGATVSTAELNILDGVTASATELNKTDGLTSTPAELNILDGATANTSEINKLDGVTASTTELNIVAGKTFKTSSGTLTTTSDTEIPSSKVIAAHVASSITAVGGFKSIADEVSFPATASQPATGVVVSINNAAGVVINGSGVSTTGRTTDGTPATITINSFPSSLYGETLAAGVGLLVTSTSTANTYTYHKLLAAETDVKQLSDDINDFNARYRIASSAPGSNNDEGDLYFDTNANKMKVYNGSAWDDVASVGSFYINTLSSSSGTGGGSATFNGSAYRFTLSTPASGGAQQLIVSVNGVIQKPNAGTSQPSEGFAVDGNDIIFSAAPASGSDFFIVTQGSSVSIGTPSANSVNSTHIIDGSIVNGDISSTANIVGSKIADDSIPEVKLDIHQAPSDGKFLKYTSSNGMEWGDVPAGVGGANGVDFNDDVKARFGTGNDLEIFHDATNSRIHNSTGDLVFRTADQFGWYGPNGNEALAKFTVNGSCELYQDNVKKFETTSGGINVTGAIHVNGAALSTLPEVTATASGAIAANDPVIVNPDGTVSKPAVLAAALGSEQEWATNEAFYLHICYEPVNNKVVVVYMDGADNQNAHAIAGAVDGSNKTITWGTTLQLFTSDYSSDHAKHCRVVATNYNGWCVVAWSSSYDSSAVKACSIQTSSSNNNLTTGSSHDSSHGQSISGIANTYITQNSGQPLDIAWDTNDGLNNGGMIFIVDTGETCYAKHIQINSNGGLTSSGSSRSIMSGNGRKSCGIEFNPDTSTYLSLSGDYDNNRVDSRILYKDGNNIGESTAVTNISGTLASDPIIHDIAYAAVHKKFLVSFKLANDHMYGLLVDTNSINTTGGQSQTYSAGTVIVIDNSIKCATMGGGVCFDDDKKCWIVNWRGDQSPSAGMGVFSKITYDGTSLSKSATTNFHAANTAYPCVAYDPDTKTVLLNYRDSADGSDGQVIVMVPAHDTLKEKNFIGFAQAGYSNGATAKVSVVGNQSTHSSLTPGSTYYVQANGTISTTAGTPSVEAGIALSSTKLLIKG